jgi:hypothetical protein
VEPDIRLWWEVHQHQADVENRDFDSFANSNFDVDASGSIKPKVNAVGLSGSELRRLMDIREALDPLAHFNFVRARLRINAYNNKYGLAADIDSNRRVGAMLLKDFKDEHSGRDIDLGPHEPRCTRFAHIRQYGRYHHRQGTGAQPHATRIYNTRGVK